jgi:hypothetical protein
MSRFMSRFLGVGALALSGIINPAVASANCVTFAGLQHCSVGGATLTINQGQLVVTGAAGAGGVAIATPGASSWHGESRIEPAIGIGATMRSSSISQGLVTSRTQAVRASDGTRLSATFTASSGTPMFTTRIYRNGQLVATSLHHASGSTAATLGYVLHWPAGEPEFDVVAGGSCTWTYRTVQGADLEITLADGRKLVGDTVQFAEEVNPQGAYPYLTFDSLVYEGDIQTVKFLSETVQ